ncbi:Rgp1 domain containing protein [Rhypophila sp. PSN 637]
MPPPEGHNNSNIRVFVNWQDQVVFAGEEVRCTITFKNVTPVPGNGSSTPALLHPSAGGSGSGFGTLGGLLSPSVSKQHPSLRQAGGGGGERRNKANAVGLAPPPSKSRGHRSSLSLSTSSTSRSRSGSVPWSPPPLDSPTPNSPARNGHGHKRSVSIMSIGSTSTVEAGGNNNGASGGPGKGQRPGRGHVRASSLQIVPRASPLNGPRSATHPQRLYASQSSPLFHASYPPDRATLNERPSGAATAPDTPRVGFSRASPTYKADVLSAFKFPMTPQSPGPAEGPQLGSSSDSTLMSPRSSVGGDFSHLPVRPKEQPAVPTINEHGALLSARVLATTSIGGTPRSSGEFYSLSNNSSETLASEYVQQPAFRGGGLGRAVSGSHNRRPSNLSSSMIAGGRVSSEALMMGYAQVQGSFTLDGSLVNLGPFEQVKRKAVVGGHGGGVVGLETPKRDSGLLRGFGWGNITSSIGELLGGSELSTIKEMRTTASSRSIPLLSTPQSILFVDLQLAPGESKSFEYAFRLPKGLPPTHRGKCMKISYSLVIGTQRPGGAREQQVKSVDVPFRVLGSVNAHGEILGHDLMSPYIILRDQAKVQTVSDPNNKNQHQKKISQNFPPLPFSSSSTQPTSTRNSFFTYVDELLSKPENGAHAGALLSPTALTPSRRQSTYSLYEDPALGVTTAKEAIDLAILRANLTSHQSSAANNRFEIARNGRHVGVVMLGRPAYRLGEQITLAVDFTGAEVPCYAVHAALETSERIVDGALALRSEASVQRVTRKVVVSHSEATLFERRMVFCPVIPASGTPEFVTSGVCLDWKVRLEFVVPVNSGQQHVQQGQTQGKKVEFDAEHHHNGGQQEEDDDEDDERGRLVKENDEENRPGRKLQKPLPSTTPTRQPSQGQGQGGNYFERRGSAQSNSQSRRPSQAQSQSEQDEEPKGKEKEEYTEEEEGETPTQEKETKPSLRAPTQEDHISSQHPLLEPILRDERGGLVLVAVENLACESFEVAVPLRVYGAVCNGLERLERDEAMDGGLVV